MNKFDEAKHPRNRGRFAPVSHREAEVTIDERFDARYWGLPTMRPGAWVFGDESCAEIVSGSVVDGPLSVGVVKKECLNTFARWQAAATEQGTTEGTEFAAGLEDGIRALYGVSGDDSTAELLGTAASDPTRHTSRVNWMLGLRSSPSKARYRGNLAAGVILSGADEWWGIADDMDLAFNGPPNPTPRRAGAWASLASR